MIEPSAVIVSNIILFFFVGFHFYGRTLVSSMKQNEIMIINRLKKMSITKRHLSPSVGTYVWEVILAFILRIA